jgi:hypothetical protein
MQTLISKIAQSCVWFFQTIADIYKNPGHSLAKKKKASYNYFPIKSINERGRIDFNFYNLCLIVTGDRFVIY